MRAKVKAGFVMIRSAGVVFSEREWTSVPAWAEAEIIKNPYLVTDRPVIDDDAPQSAPERETSAIEDPAQVKVTDTAQTVEDTATRLVEKEPARRKGRRKL